VRRGERLIPTNSGANDLRAAMPPGEGLAPRLVVVASALTKSFSGVRALDDVSISIRASEVTAILGQNGAGKSTLIQIMAGIHPAGSYSGRLQLEGKPFTPVNAAEAERAGVALVPQEISVVPEMSVAENICLNAEPTRWGLIDVAARKAQAHATLRDFELDIDPGADMRSLDLATQQLVVIARALSKKLKLLILDEPTAALTEKEAIRLFDRVQRLKERGVATIFVSHRLREVFSIADRIVVMRDGHIHGDHAASDISRMDVVAEMVGEARDDTPRRRERNVQAPELEVRELSVFDPGDTGRRRVDDFSLIVRRGEVVGLFGLLDAGCVEAALAIYGAWRGRWSGDILIGDRLETIAGPQEAIELGLGLLAQDRRDGLIADQSVFDNMMVAANARGGAAQRIDGAAQRRSAIDLTALLNIKAKSIDAEVRTLSGGNQQKVQIARWLAVDAQTLILLDPTRGVDVGARTEINKIWLELSERGRSILIVSSDAEELSEICDRVVVMRKGRKAGELSGEGLTERALLRMATDD
jgi:ABC-type sugar transport system ATPase subunit